MPDVVAICADQRLDCTWRLGSISGSEGAGGRGVLWQDLCDAPVLGLHRGRLHQLQIQNSLVLAALVNPVVAAKHIPDVCGQVQHVHIPGQHSARYQVLTKLR